MRKYIFSGTVVSALFGGVSTVQATRNGPRDWRLIAMWVSWGLSVAVAVGTVIEESRDNSLSLDK